MKAYAFCWSIFTMGGKDGSLGDFWSSSTHYRIILNYLGLSGNLVRQVVYSATGPVLSAAG